MGRSAKVHKRIKKIKSSTSQPAPALVVHPPAKIQASSSKQAQVQAPAPAGANVKRRNKLKEKAKSKQGLGLSSGASGGRDGHVLGGADYVELMMGSRRRAREEAAKLSAAS